jgi:hypothetical protein
MQQGDAWVETNKPNSNYKSAFAGQTRAPGVKTKATIVATVINSELKQHSRPKPAAS